MRMTKRDQITPTENLYDIKMENNHNFVLANGLVVHNCGTGVGFSVENQYTDKLPTIAEEFSQSSTTIIVEDSKAGWAKAYKELVSLLIGGQIPKWDLSKLRPAGARLKTFGGRASGPGPLDELFRFTSESFKRAAGRKLTSIECHDIVCKIAEVVVVGGVRRSALISLSNLADEKMRDAKTGAWWNENPQRALANNSIAYKSKPDIGIFMEEWISLYKSKSGERGIFNREAARKTVEKLGDRRDPNHEWGCNPCCLPADALVETSVGQIPILEIINNPDKFLVLSYNHNAKKNEYAKIIHGKMTRPNAALVELQITDPLANVMSLQLTPDHRVWTENRGYVEASNLNDSDELVISTNYTYRNITNTSEMFASTNTRRIKSVKPIDVKVDTYDIQTVNSNFFANGVLVHNSEILLRDREFCNLSEVVVRADDTEESLKRKIRIATILGTFQSSLTHFPYLSSEWKRNCEEEALLGVSLTGILDNAMMSEVCEDTENLLARLRESAVAVNRDFARRLGINPAAAITCVKPSGCGTLDTKIKTTEGDMSFNEIFELCGKNPETLHDGTWVIPSTNIFVVDENNDPRKITKLFVKGMSPVFEIEDENGNVYKFSSEHKLKTKNGWKYMRELTVNDEILSFDPIGNIETLYTSVLNQGERENG